MNIATIKKVILEHIDLPVHKIRYIIVQPEYVLGLWETLTRYGIPYNRENHELLVELVQDKLVGPDIECEWTENEYNTFVEFKE